MKRLRIIENDELGAETRFLTESEFSDSNRNRISIESPRSSSYSLAVLSRAVTRLCGRNARDLALPRHFAVAVQIGVKYRNGTPQNSVT